MAQYRKTFFSMGGPTRIADPGADELARMLALRLQQQQQAQQGAQETAKLSLEERLAGERMRREDDKIALERSAQQQQRALADRSYGLQERQLGETLRGNKVSEGQGERKIAFDERSLTERLGLERRQIDVQERGQREARKSQEQQRLMDQAQAQAEIKQRGRMAGDELAARMSENKQRLTAQADEGRLQREAEAKLESMRVGRSDRELSRALGAQATEKSEAARRAGIGAAGLALQGFNLGGKIPDDPNVEAGYIPRGAGIGLGALGTSLLPAGGGGVPAALGALAEAVLGAQDPTTDLKPIVDAIDTSFAAAAPGMTSVEDVRSVGSALRDQMLADFQRAFEVQRREFGVDNSREQAQLYLMALDELNAVEDKHAARVAGGPGAPGPKRNVYVRPAR